MMKRFWVSPFATNDNMCSISFESEQVEPEHRRIRSDARIFPDTPADAPKRHVINIGLFDDDDLLMMQGEIESYLRKRGLS